MPVQNETNDELAAGIGSRLREAEDRARLGGHVVVLALLIGAHKLLDMAQNHALSDGQVNTLSGGTDKGP